MIYIGTSGFSYDDWVGPYYSPNLSKNDWLTFYAKEFNTLEINYTYYRMPTARTLAGMARKTPNEFLFTIKTPPGDDAYARRRCRAFSAVQRSIETFAR